MTVEAIAPVLRGLTYNGEYGAVVRFTGKEPAGDRGTGSSVLKIKTPADESAAAREFGAAMEKYDAVNNGLPENILVEGLGNFRISPRRRIAVVTGGAQGFGAGLVEKLAEKDVFVFIADMNIAGAEEFAGEMNKKYGPEAASAVRVNVSDEASVEEMTAEVVRQAGGIDLFVNNAGVLRAGSVKEQPLDDFEFVTKVNYTGYFLCVKYASRVMAAQNSAAVSAGKEYFTDIIQINSKSGLQGSNKNGAYAGGKFGGIGLTQSFALELVTDNIKVNSICPGNYFEGPLWSDPDKGLFVQYLKAGKVPGAKTIEDVKAFYEAKVPMGRGCRPEDIAKALFYLMDQKYETGQALPVTGGQIMLK